MTDEPDPTVVALGRAVQRALRRLDTVDKNVLQLAADVTALGVQLTGARPEAAPLWSWFGVDDPVRATEDLAALVEWVDAVYLRFSGVQLPSCWLWHPDAIEELRWLRGAHADAYDPEHGSWLRVGDWHDRQRPGVVRRLHADLGACALDRHADTGPRGREVHDPEPAPLGAHHGAVARTWVATRTAGPDPDAALLAEAKQAGASRTAGRAGASPREHR